jgi:hypothetical protein
MQEPELHRGDPQRHGQLKSIRHIHVVPHTETLHMSKMRGKQGPTQ